MVLAPLMGGLDADAADVYYVRQYTSPPTSPSGLSWNDAFPSIDAAFASVTFVLGDELWVAASGATPYHPTQNVSGDLPRTAHFKIDQNFVHIKGGFPSNPPNGWDERDLEMHATVLSGDLNDDNPPYDPDTYDDTVSELHDNAYQVVRVFDVNDSCVIDGLVIRDGHGWNGILALPEGFGYINNGGGMELRSDVPGKFATPYIQNCKFLDNFASQSGGAMSIVAKSVPVAQPWMDDPEDYDSLVKIRTCEFRANRVKVDTGGAINFWGGGLDIAGTLIADNYSPWNGSAINAYLPKPLLITNCTITNNRSYASVPAVAAGKSLLQPEEPSLPSDPPLDIFIVRNSIVSGNRDGQEGGGSGEFTIQLGTAKTGVYTAPQLDYSIVWGSVVGDESPYGDGNQNTACLDPDFFYDRDNADVFLRDYRVRLSTFPRGPVDLGDEDEDVLPPDERDANDNGNVSEKLPDVRRFERLVAALPESPTRVDIGAYEMTQEETSIEPPVCVGDLDFDGVIGASDLAILLGGWGAGGSGCAADLDVDGAVAASDLAILLGLWGQPCPEAPGLPEPFAAMSSVGEFALTPADLAAALGFDTIDSLAAWLGTLSPESRAALLTMLSEAGGEM